MIFHLYLPQPQSLSKASTGNDLLSTLASTSSERLDTQGSDAVLSEPVSNVVSFTSNSSTESLPAANIICSDRTDAIENLETLYGAASTKPSGLAREAEAALSTSTSAADTDSQNRYSRSSFASHDLLDATLDGSSPSLGLSKLNSASVPLAPETQAVITSDTTQGAPVVSWDSVASSTDLDTASAAKDKDVAVTAFDKLPIGDLFRKVAILY